MKNFINNIIKEILQDVVVTGYIDSENLLTFHPMYERLFFIFNNSTYEIYTENGLIKSNKIDNISLWFDLDEDDQFAQMSIYSQLFKTEQEIRLSKVNYSQKPFSNIHIFFHEGAIERELILDPNNFFGFTFL